MRNMAQGAAGAMKNAVGMGGSDAPNHHHHHPAMFLNFEQLLCSLFLCQ